MGASGFRRIAEVSCFLAMCCQGSARIAMGRDVAVIPLPTSLYAKALEREADSCHQDVSRRCGMDIRSRIATSFPLHPLSSRRSGKCLVLYASSASPFPICTRNSPVANLLPVVVFCFFYTVY